MTKSEILASLPAVVLPTGLLAVSGPAGSGKSTFVSRCIAKQARCLYPVEEEMPLLHVARSNRLKNLMAAEAFVTSEGVVASPVMALFATATEGLPSSASPGLHESYQVSASTFAQHATTSKALTDHHDTIASALKSSSNSLDSDGRRARLRKYKEDLDTWLTPEVARAFLSTFSFNLRLKSKHQVHIYTEQREQPESNSLLIRCLLGSEDGSVNYGVMTNTAVIEFKNITSLAIMLGTMLPVYWTSMGPDLYATFDKLRQTGAGAVSGGRSPHAVTGLSWLNATLIEEGSCFVSEMRDDMGEDDHPLSGGARFYLGLRKRLPHHPPSIAYKRFRPSVYDGLSEADLLLWVEPLMAAYPSVEPAQFYQNFFSRN